MTTQKEYFKQYWIKNRTKINKKHREYYKKINGDWHKEYYQKNRERILTSHKEYYWNIRRNLICKFNKKLFSKQDDAIIKKWFGKITAKEIHKKYIPNWDTKSIITRANRLGLKSNTSFLHEGRRNYFFGKHHSKETKRKLSIANTGRFIGEENPAYKDGKGREPYPMGWHEGLREKIRIRDNHNCQICGIHQSRLPTRLIVHHIDRNHKNISPINLISLCLFHHGKIQFFQNDLQDYFYALNIGLLPKK